MRILYGGKVEADGSMGGNGSGGKKERERSGRARVSKGRRWWGERREKGKAAGKMVSG
jgi:hypothetical protein